MRVLGLLMIVAGIIGIVYTVRTPPGVQSNG